MFKIDGQYRTSIIVDPPNGRLPEISAAGKTRRATLKQKGWFKNDGTAWWLEQITMLCSASLSSLRSAGFQPAWRPGWPPSQAGSPPIPSLAAWGQPLSFPTSADWHGYNLS